MAFSYVTVVGQYLKVNGTAASGELHFKLTTPMVNDDVVVAGSTSVLLDADGSFSVILPSNGDPDTTPSNAAYVVTERLNEGPVRTYSVRISETSGTVSLSDLAQQVIINPGQPVYALLRSMNLADLEDPAIARQNLGIEDVAVDPAVLGIVVDADRTGATDATPAINAAINQAATLGLAVRLPAGTYRLDSSIKPVSGTQLIGAGPGLTVLRPQGTVAAIENLDFEWEGNPTLDDCVFRDFEIDGTDQTLTNGAYSVATKGLFIEGMRRLLIDNLYIHDTIATGIGIDFIGGGTIRSCTLERCGRGNDGSQPGGAGIGVGVGFLSGEWEPLTIEACTASECGTYGIFVESQSQTRTPSGVTIIGCMSRGNRRGIGEAGANATKIIGCHIYGNTVAGVSIDPGTLFEYDQSQPGRYTTIADCDIRDNFHGVWLVAWGKMNLRGPLIHGNTIRSNWHDGIRIELFYADNMTQSRYVTIRGNEILNNGENGIRIMAPSAPQQPLPFARLIVENNRIFNCGTWMVANQNAAIKCEVPTEYAAVRYNSLYDDQPTPTMTRGVVFASTVTHTGWVVDGNLTTLPNTLPPA